MERKSDDLKENGLEQALAHLERAEGESKVAETAEEAAEKEIHEALKEIKEAEAHRHEIHFSVDGEHYETETQEMTPDEIIREFGAKDPTTNYLVQIAGSHEKVSYQGKGSEPIKLHNGVKFQTISTGPMTVSDGAIHAGVDFFSQGLRDLGYAPVALSGSPDHLVFEYQVETGRFAGKVVRHGIIVPADFPVTPPSGPHVSPHIHPLISGGVHPTGGVHASGTFDTAAGGQWQYWSRPFTDWAQQSKKTAAAYMSHIWRLWDSQ